MPSQHKRGLTISVSTVPTRLEAELEAKRAKERDEMMRELQAIKEAAQREIEAQKDQYHEHLEKLSSKMVYIVVVRAT